MSPKINYVLSKILCRDLYASLYMIDNKCLLDFLDKSKIIHSPAFNLRQKFHSPLGIKDWGGILKDLCKRSKDFYPALSLQFVRKNSYERLNAVIKLCIFKYY
jgi:hypothetical protein